MTCQGSHCRLERAKGNGTRKGRLLRWLLVLSGSSQGHSVDSTRGVESKKVRELRELVLLLLLLWLWHL